MFFNVNVLKIILLLKDMTPEQEQRLEEAKQRQSNVYFGIITGWGNDARTQLKTQTERELDVNIF